MDYISRKVFLTRDLRSFDSDGDGILDSLILSATTKTIQIPLTQSYDDMGIFNTSIEETFEIIDIASIFNDLIQSDQVFQPLPPISGNSNNWNTGGGSSGVDPTNSETIYYCGDITADNGGQLTCNSSECYFTYKDGTTSSVYTNPLPIFIENPSLCTYPSTIVDGSYTPEQQTGIGMQCLYSSPCAELSEACNCSTGDDWTKKLWIIYNDEQLRSESEIYCQSKGKTRIMSDSDFIVNGNTLPQGDTTTEGSLAFAGIKLSGTQSDTPDTFCFPNTVYRYKFCFYCI